MYNACTMSFSLKRLVKSAFTVLLCGATFHMTLLTIIAIKERNIVIWNLFNILDLDYFFPWMIEGFWSQIISAVTIVVLIAIAYVAWTKKERA